MWGDIDWLIYVILLGSYLSNDALQLTMFDPYLYNALHWHPLVNSFLCLCLQNTLKE